MDVHTEPIPTGELLKRLCAAGYPTTDRQLERWRNEELLLRFGTNVFRSTPMRHLPDAVAQAIAIHRCLAVKNRFDFAGPLLWAGGFDVGERHYADPLERADRTFRKISTFVAWLIKRVERSHPDRTLGDVAGDMRGLTGILAKIGRLAGDQKPRLINVVADVASGEFKEYDLPATDREISTAEVFNKAFGFEPGSQDHVFGSRLRLGISLEERLRNISEMQGSYRLGGFSQEEIQSARNDVRDAMKIAICLYDAMAWIYGANAFGLRLPALFMRTVPIHFIFMITLGFARFRKIGAEIYASDEIFNLARQSEAIWLISTHFREMCRTRPDLAYMVSPNRMKASLSSKLEMKNLLKDLEAYQFPKPEFRPWNSWQKLAKRTMSPGLLVMSIGSPEHISTADVVANANVGKSP